MPEARLEVTDALGRRIVPIDKTLFAIGRRTGNDLRLVGSDVSRDHAEITRDEDKYVLKDRGSRYGTFVNGETVNEKVLTHGDQIRIGRSGGAELIFLVDDVGPSIERTTTSAVGDLRQISALLEGLRALGSGRVLDEVLALVMDSTIEVTGAERGFIMLANAGGELEFKLARARGRVTLPGKTFETSRKIPEEVFATGEERIVQDLLDGGLENHHHQTVALGIRHVLCVPLRLVRYIDRAEAAPEQKRIGVLYLDSRERGSLLSKATRTALDVLAAEAAVAIENARLYRDNLDKARIEQELKIAAEIQRALLPENRHTGGYFEAVAESLPCRAIGGDFFDYIDAVSGGFGFALGDVAGKGAPAALLTAVIQGIFSAQAYGGSSPAETIGRVNQALIRRAIESRFATIFHGMLLPDGRLVYCNAGHNPPLLMTKHGVQRLEKGGLIVGLFDHATFDDETLQLEPGDVLVVFSDGVTEALNVAGDEFTEERLLKCITTNLSLDPQGILNAVITEVKRFATGADQSDDVTAMVLRYGG